jgi:hypothetical protein
MLELRESLAPPAAFSAAVARVRRAPVRGTVVMTSGRARERTVDESLVLSMPPGDEVSMTWPTLGERLLGEPGEYTPRSRSTRRKRSP